MLKLARIALLSTLALSSCVSYAAEPSASCPRLAVSLADVDRKFNPGHYVAVSRAEAGNLVTAAQTPGISGVQRRYRWSQLEPTPGVYDLRIIEADLTVAARAGVQLIALLEDKSFDGTKPTPPYLHGEHTLQAKRGHVAKRWDPYVLDRLIRLTEAIGQRFDCDPNFEGIALQETALSMDPADLRAAGYTADKYRDALIRLLQGATAGLQRSRVFWYMNFLPGGQQYLDDIAKAIAGTGVVMGGPDILPDNEALAQRVYPLYDRFEGQLKLFGSMQHDSYRHPRGKATPGLGKPEFWSMEELFLFARDRLHVNYVIWEYRTKRTPPDGRDWSEARDVIARYPELRLRQTGSKRSMQRGVTRSEHA